MTPRKFIAPLGLLLAGGLALAAPLLDRATEADGRPEPVTVIDGRYRLPADDDPGGYVLTVRTADGKLVEAAADSPTATGGYHRGQAVYLTTRQGLVGCGPPARRVRDVVD